MTMANNIPAIKGFKDNDFAFLSNFYPCNIIFDGLSFKCSEGAYMAQKTLDLNIREKFCTLSGPEAKKLGRAIPIRKDWDNIKIDIMKRVVTAKFNQNSNLAHLLLQTGNAYLEETNWWGDTFWGVCKGKGENHLGKILMEVRNSLSS